ncbi:MAG: Lrp/AsnC family transcriptional regulator [Candidatus Bathyarchaeota archaeon]|nr:MAG: Lrp/AsnC family transcriptional regulator [Candidatus Bathyarchaeota archaeon]
MRKELAQQLLRELLKNSKRSDRDLAKILKVSQPTITRTRHKLERNGMIQHYTIIPDFRKMGFEILALNFVKIRPKFLSSETNEKARKFVAKFPNTIFASSGEGMGMTGVSISFYKNYREYHKSLDQMRSEWKDLVEDVQSFIISIGEGQFKRFSLTPLKDVSL